VLAGPPRPLASIAPHAPDELVTIASKAIACDPAARYRNASALAEDLRRYQTGQLVSAHSYTTWSLMRRKLVRNRAAVAVAAAGVLALGAVGVASVRRVVAERNIARNERTRAESALSSAEQRQRQLVLLQAVTSLRKDPTAALAWLKLAPVSAEDRAQVVDVIDEAVAAGVAHQVFRPGDWVFDTVFAPDGRSVIVGARDGRLRSYDLATGAMRELGRAPSAPAVLALQPGGDAVAAGGWMGDVTLWPIAGGAPRTLAASGAMVSSLRFSADGTHLLVDRETGVPEDVELVTGKRTPLGDPAALHVEVATEDWRRRVVLATPNEVARPDGTPLAQTAKAITFLGLSPRGDTVIVHDGALVSAVPSAGGALRPLVKYDGKLAGAEFSPDRTTIALFGQRPEIVLVELATGASRELRGHTDQIYSAQFTHDGRTLLTASDDGTARVWNLRDGSALELRGHDDDVYRARFSADERQVATSSLDGSVRVWSLDQPGPRVFTEGAPIESLAIVGDRVVTKTAGAVAAWDLATGTRDELFAWSQDPHGLGVGVASPDGTQLLVPLADWSMEIRRHGAPPVVLRGHHGQISHVEWSRDGASLYSSSLDGSLRRWNVASGDGVALVDGDRPVKSFAVGADGRVVAQVGDDAVEISATGTSHVLGSGPRWCAQAMEFEQVRDRLVLRRCDSTLALVDHGRTIELATDGYAVSRTAVSADGRRLAGAMGDRTVRVWDAQTGELRKVLRGHSDLVMDVAFSPDGSQLASASYDKTVWIWQLETGRHRVLRGHGGAVERVAWSDRRLVTGSRDGTVRVWDVPSLAPPTTAELTARLAAATTAAIDRDDRPTTTSSDQPPQKLDLGAMLDRSFAAGHS
jgi:WD40 repeat protein